MRPIASAVRPPRLRRRWALAALAVPAATLLGGCERLSASIGLQGFKGMDVTGAPYGGGVALTDHDGRPRSLADFRGEVVLLYFGFVQCPDVCPTALARAVAVKQALGRDGERFRVLFVTVDPERDTPEVLRAYMAAFDPGFVALTGSAAEIRSTADAFRAFYRKVPTGSGYTMDHSALSYLFDARGRLRVALRHQQGVDDYVSDVRALLRDDRG